MKIIFVTLLVFSLVVSSLSLQPSSAALSGFCGSKCTYRCGKAGLAKRCLTYCGICCQRCNCVPSGTYGNKSECHCYRDMLNSKGKSKCP